MESEDNSPSALSQPDGLGPVELVHLAIKARSDFILKRSLDCDLVSREIRKKENMISSTQEIIRVFKEDGEWDLYLQRNISLFKALVDHVNVDPSVGRNVLLTMCVDAGIPSMVSALLRNDRVLKRIKGSPCNGLTRWRYRVDSAAPVGWRTRTHKDTFAALENEEDDKEIEKLQEEVKKHAKRELVLCSKFEKLKDISGSHLFLPGTEPLFFSIRCLMKADLTAAMLFLGHIQSATWLDIRSDCCTTSLNLLADVMDVDLPISEDDNHRLFALLLLIFTHQDYRPMARDKMSELFRFCRVNMSMGVALSSPEPCIREFDGYQIEEIVVHLEKKAREKIMRRVAIMEMDIPKEVLFEVAISKRHDDPALLGSIGEEEVLNRVDDVVMETLVENGELTTDHIEKMAQDPFTSECIKYWCFWMRNPVPRRKMIECGFGRRLLEHGQDNFFSLAVSFSR
jgi:hypothetical protein